MRLSRQPDELSQELHTIVSQTACTSAVRTQFMERVELRAFTRDEDEVSHSCVYFLPCHPLSRHVYLVHHRKSGLWISPGGHIDRGESLRQTLGREIHEGLGYVPGDNLPEEPALLTIAAIDNPQ